MCRIYYAKRVSKYPVRVSEQTRQALTNELAESARINPDGAGLLIDGKVERSIDSVSELNEKFIQAVENLVQGDEVYLHHRMATQGGITEGNTQPIETNRYIVIHNGHFESGYKYSKYGYEWTGKKYYGPYMTGGKGSKATDSDTVEFATELEKMGVDYSKLDLSDIVEEALASFYGSFSLFVIDKQSKESVYTKSSNTNFTFWYLPDNGLVLGSTSDKLIDCFGQSIGYFTKNVEHYTFNPSDDAIYPMDSVTGCF